MNPMQLINQLIDPIIMALVFLSGFSQEKYLVGISFSKDKRWDASIKTLGLSFIVTTIYILLVVREGGIFSLVKYFFTYFMTTSIYDIAIRPIRKWITRMLNKYFPSDEKQDHEPTN
jgi:hypothetical protein